MTGYKKLLDQVEEGSLANKELNEAKFEMMRNVNGASAIRENLANRIRLGQLSPEDVRRELGWQGDGIQGSLDIWNGTADTSLSAESVEDFMKQRVDSRVAGMRADADGASVEDAPFDLRWIRSQMETGSTESANRRDNNRVGSLDEYGQLVTEMTSILHTVEALRDPTNRATMRPDQIMELETFMRRLEMDFMQARNFLADQVNAGNDITELDAVLRQQLDKYGVGDLLDGDPAWTSETMTRANQAGMAYRAARDDGNPATPEAADYLAGVRDLLTESPSPFLHRNLYPAIVKLTQEQIAANGGTIPDEMREILRDPAFEQFGAFSEVLGRLDIDDMIRDPDIDLREATYGRYAQVEWQDISAVDPALLSDDRPEGDDDVIADVAWRDALEQVTPNVAAALSSMFTTMGGGIHRVKTNITEADVPQAESWRAEGWKRGGGGSDVRSPDQVEGVYTKDTNLVIIADQRVVHDTGTGSNVVVHELGHALDSMLGETLSEGDWFSSHDPEFKKFHEAIKAQAQYGDSPEQSLMHWYFRDITEGAASHNGVSGNKEVFAEGYAAYAAGLQRLANLPEGSGPITEETTYVLIGKQLTGERGQLVEWAGELSFEQVRKREAAIGHAIMDFYGDLEENRLPKMMSEPKAMPVRSELRQVMMGLGAVPRQKVATPSEKEKANTHNSAKHGLIQMTPIERDTPGWQEMEQQVKAVSPGASMPPPTAIYVTWNPAFAEQGASVIWKAVMPGVPKYTVEYTDEHKATQLAAKFQRQQRVDKALNEVHAKAEAEALYDETAALVLAMIETGMRVGSSEKAGSKDRTTGKTIKTFGGATMLKKHVFFPSDTLMRFRFPGKAGKVNTYESRNPALRAAVTQLLEGKGPSDQVFAQTNSGRSIDYIRSATGIEDVINHDTRTRYATNMARDLVAKWPKSKLPKNEAAVKKAQTEVAKKVGAAINDTWTVARDSYISNAVWERFEDSAGIPHSFDDSPPYGLIEGGTVTTGVPGAPGGPPAPTEGEAPAPVAAAAEAPVEEVTEEIQTDSNPEPEIEYTLDHSPESVAEREQWYGSYVWPDPPIVAGPDTEVEPDDTQEPDEIPAEQETEEVE